jgi:hypothetical protein
VLYGTDAYWRGTFLRRKIEQKRGLDIGEREVFFTQLFEMQQRLSPLRGMSGKQERSTVAGKKIRFFPRGDAP